MTGRRPLAMRMLPAGARAWLYQRHYARRHDHYPGLFACAPIHAAPGHAMYDLQPGDIISGNLAFAGGFEKGLTERLRTLGRAGGLLVDVGANMGYFSLVWAAANPANRVIAFEASPSVFNRLVTNIERNHLVDRIEARPEAASDIVGTVRFDTGPADQTGWGGIAPESAQDVIEVPTVRLDQALGGQPIDVLKIDVEGAELLVLRGCEALLRARRIHHIFFEYNPMRTAQLGFAGDACLSFLQAAGYRCTPIARGADDWHAEPA